MNSLLEKNKIVNIGLTNNLVMLECEWVGLGKNLTVKSFKMRVDAGVFDSQGKRQV